MAANASLAQERDRLSAENQGLEQARTDNQEVQRLKTELQDLPKVRSQYQEAARLRKENEQLAREVAKLSPHSKTNQPGADARGVASAAADGSLAQTEGDKKAVAPDESTINEQDEVLVDPSVLKQLLPAFDWDKVGRTNAVSVRSLIEKDGIQLTNIAQLPGLRDYELCGPPFAAPEAETPSDRQCTGPAGRIGSASALEPGHSSKPLRPALSPALRPVALYPLFQIKRPRSPAD